MLAETDRHGLHETCAATTHTPHDAPEMHFAMVEGVAVAALEHDRTAQVAVQCWRARRNAGIGASRLRVGHMDIVATPG
jgi:hypothetical protein